MTDRRWADVAVVGGGPAGSTVAHQLAAAGADVLLCHDGRDRWQRIGQQLPVVPVDLGATELTASRSVWTGEGVDHRPHPVGPHGRPGVVDRADLDRRLRALAVQAGARLLPGEAAPVRERRGGSWQLPGWRVPLVVDASGQRRVLARDHLPWETADRLRCQVWRVAAGPAEPWTLVETDPLGWWYSAPTAGLAALTVLRVTALGRAGPHRPPRYTAERLAGAELGCRPVERTALVGHCRTPWAPGLLAVGESALRVDPLSAAGLRGVFQLAAPAAAAVLGLLGGDEAAAGRYAELVTEAYRLHLVERGHHLGGSRHADQLFFRERSGPQR